MALFAMSDLHLSFGTDKPMDVFGRRWQNHTEKIKENWQSTVSPEDTVIINGDISWATYLDDCVLDFDFINSLNGRKIISKGNHDYWWTTVSKHDKFCMEHGFETINFLHNNFYMYKDTAICGARGWIYGSAEQGDDKKIYNREIERFKLSLNCAMKENPKEIIAVLHYPPDDNFCKVMEDYPVTLCLYGHLHGEFEGIIRQTKTEGIKYQLVSCDYLSFMPFKIDD